MSSKDAKSISKDGKSASKDGKSAAKGSKESFSVLGCFKRHFSKTDLSPSGFVEEVFSKYSDSGAMRAERFAAFLTECQGEQGVTAESAQHIMDNEGAHEKHILTRTKGHPFTKERFFQYLLDTTANLPIKSQVHQDMSLPASHYYVFTGHNSYLTGNQLSSDCSEVPIIEALKKGVRVIELDLWPDKKDKNKISVLHGNTITSPVDFEVCITAIRDNAFVKSEYPCVVTFEDHLSPELQAKAAEITTRVLGKLLYIPELNERFAEFPSPDAMKGRILISTKPPKEYMKSAKKGEDVAEVETAPTVGKVTEQVKKVNVKGGGGPQKKQFDWGDDIPDFDSSQTRARLDASKKPVDAPESEDEDEDEDEDEEGAIDHAAHPEYKRIISIRASKPKGKSLVSALVIDDFVKRVSLSEPQLEKVAESKPSALIEFTQRNLLRIYPYGLRLDSSNYNPMIAWSHGAQMVAFNMQGYGRPLWLVEGFFRANGGCGFVKKPDFLFPSENGAVFDPRKEIPVKTTLKVRVLQGVGWLERFGKHHFDNFSPPDFYVRVGIAGVPADSGMKKTRTIEDDWIPDWSEEFEFPLTVPELALLRVEVHEYDMTDKDDFGGQTCYPVLELKKGLRAIPLLSKKGVVYEGVRLLFNFEFTPAL